MVIVFGTLITAACEEQGGRFEDNGDGTVTETKTGLMWAARDNGADVTWEQANTYCEEYAGGGYTDWRMPTLPELKGLFDKGHYSPTETGYSVHLTPLIRLSCHLVWSSELEGAFSAQIFHFFSGSANLSYRTVSEGARALPVRSAKRGS